MNASSHDTSKVDPSDLIGMEEVEVGQSTPSEILDRAKSEAAATAAAEDDYTPVREEGGMVIVEGVIDDGFLQGVIEALALIEGAEIEFGDSWFNANNRPEDPFTLSLPATEAVQAQVREILRGTQWDNFWDWVPGGIPELGQWAGLEYHWENGDYPGRGYSVVHRLLEPVSCCLLPFVERDAAEDLAGEISEKGFLLYEESPA